MTITRLASECPDCKRPLRRKQGRNGEFLGCSGFPRCKFTEPLDLNLERIARQLNAAESDADYLKAWAAAVRETAHHMAGKLCPDCAKHLAELEAVL